MMQTARYALALLLVLALTPYGRADEPPEEEARACRLVRAVMCESITGYEPKYISVAFSIRAVTISCYTSFDDVSDTTFVEHKWYRRDELVTVKRLTLKPPQWSTYSSVQLREDDKGPWRVEVWDARNQMIKTLRFSVTD
jgi:hypothetical protein